MKPISFISLLLWFCSSHSLVGQIIFSEDFQTGLPGTWTLIDNDGLTPDPTVAQFTSAWIVGDNFDQTGDSVMMSTSWYSPVGMADDWLITPPINLTANNILEWDAQAPDPNFADGYEVRISTTTPTIPGFMANTALFTVGAENSTWTYRSVNLQTAGYANQQVYLAWRNNSNDKFILMVDSITVKVQVNYDASLTELIPKIQYPQIPLSQTMNILQSGIIENAGNLPITSAKLQVRVFDSDMNLVHSDMSSSDTLLVGASDTFTLSGYTPMTVDTFSLTYFADINQTDGFPSNDTMYQSAIVSDSVYAREDGIVTGALGIGAGASGELGQLFELKNPDTLTSVSAFIANGGGQMTGQPLSANIYSVVNGVPSVILGSTDTVVVDSSMNRFWTLAIPGGLEISLDSFAVVVVEPDSNVTLGTSTNYFCPATTYINWPTSPFGTWAPAEAFGAQFSVSFLLRANFGHIKTYITDAAIIDVEFPSEYTQLPLNQIRGCPLNLGCLVKNVDCDTITNITTCCNIYRDNMSSPIATYNSDTIGQLLHLEEHMSSFDTSFRPSAPGTYLFEYIVKIAENDTINDNDTAYTSLVVVDSLFARDNSMVSGALSIGSGVSGILGQNYTFKSPDSLYGAYFFCTSPSPGDTTSMVVYDVNETTGEPISLIAESPMRIFTLADSLNPSLIKISLANPIRLPAGTYYVGFRETSGGTLTLAYDNDIFTPSTGWVFFNNAWGTNEFYGFPSAYILRPVFSNCKDSLLLAATILGNEMQIFYQASWNISSSDTIKSGATDIYYDSGGSIDLLPGFIIEHGASWKTLSNGCGQSMVPLRAKSLNQENQGIAHRTESPPGFKTIYYAKDFIGKRLIEKLPPDQTQKRLIPDSLKDDPVLKKEKLTSSRIIKKNVPLKLDSLTKSE